MDDADALAIASLPPPAQRAFYIRALIRFGYQMLLCIWWDRPDGIRMAWRGVQIAARGIWINRR